MRSTIDRFTRGIALCAILVAAGAACGAEPTPIVHTGVDMLAGATSRVQEGYFQELAVDHPGSGPAIVAIDDEDRIWVALAKAGKLAMISNGAVQTFDFGQDSRPVGVVAGSKANGYPGSIWVAASYDNKIIRFDVRSGAKKEYVLPGKDGWPFNIVLDTVGRVWFTQRAAGTIGWLEPASGKMTIVQLPKPGSGPAGLGIDTRNGDVWFTQSLADSVCRYEPATGRITQYQMSQNSTGLISGPAGLTVGPQGDVWFAKLEGKLGHIAPGSDKIELIATPPAAARPAGITLDHAGNVWSVALDGNALLRFDPKARDFALYPLPVGEPDASPRFPPEARSSRPFGLAFDRQGNLWFSQQYTGQVGVLDLAKPELTVASPGADVRVSDPYLTVNVSDRVAGVADVTVSLDGKPVTLKSGRLDLSHAVPGEHDLLVRAKDRAGLESVVRKNFKYSPGPGELSRLIGRLRLKDPAGRALLDSVKMSAEESKDGKRLGDLQDLLAQHHNDFVDDDYAVVDATLRWMIDQGSAQQFVTISDKPPYFRPQTVTLRKGGSITWLYQPEQVGHSMSSSLHQVTEQSAGLKSPLLRAGEKYTFRFEQTGAFHVTDAKQPDAAAEIVVTP
jgi:streptogramin lyase/plastocyanin